MGSVTQHLLAAQSKVPNYLILLNFPHSPSNIISKPRNT